MIVRLCKVALVGTVALFFLLVAWGNLTDSESNWQFVRHVLAMDTIFPGSDLTWRAITDERLQGLAYAAIIGWQVLTSAVLCVATLWLALACGSAQRFAISKPLAVLGLTLGFLLYSLGFTVIGGEWFAMWQSKTWNGLDSAARFMLLDGVALLVLLLPEREG